jgi:hypothetical protein
MKNLFLKGTLSRDFQAGFHDYFPLPCTGYRIVITKSFSEIREDAHTCDFTFAK